MMRQLLLALVLLTLVFPSFSAPPAAEAAPTLQGSCSNTLYQPAGQSFWVGYPATANANGPVVVFVHGYTGDHNTWTGGSYSVREACNQGFRVAAVDLGGTSSIWDNGASLSAKLQAIATYYGVARVNVMAHSKGGLDTQAAVVHYGGHPYVQSYVTYGTPFGGTDLADHACSWYAWALWQCNDATWTMRTGYMSYVRSITDGRPENDVVSAFAARGTKCDWYNPACLMISGADDGVVPAWSVWANGEDTHISDRSDLRHGEVHQAQRYNVGWLFSFLGRATTLAEGDTSPSAREDVPLFATSAYALRGGELTGRVLEQVVVEGGLSAVTFSLLSTERAQVVVVSPSGVRHEARVRRTATGSVLQGLHYDVRVPRPEAGIWHVEAAPLNDQHTGYLLRTLFEGGLTVQLNNDLRTIYRPGSTLTLDVTTSQPVQALTLTSTLRGEDNLVVTTGQGKAVAQTMALPIQAGTYNVELSVTGITDEGTPFERTLVTSIAVVDLEDLEEPASIR